MGKVYYKNNKKDSKTRIVKQFKPD